MYCCKFFNENIFKKKNSLDPKPPNAGCCCGAAVPNDGVLNEKAGGADDAPNVPKPPPKPENAFGAKIEKKNN